MASGETFLGPSIVKVLAEEVRHPGEGKEGTVGSLTPRERQILRFVAQGQTNARIAEMLSISVNTVEWHRANVMTKLGAHTVVDLVRYALQHGFADIKD